MAAGVGEGCHERGCTAQGRRWSWRSIAGGWWSAAYAGRGWARRQARGPALLHVQCGVLSTYRANFARGLNTCPHPSSLPTLQAINDYTRALQEGLKMVNM